MVDNVLVIFDGSSPHYIDTFSGKKMIEFINVHYVLLYKFQVQTVFSGWLKIDLAQSTSSFLYHSIHQKVTLFLRTLFLSDTVTLSRIPDSSPFDVHFNSIIMHYFYRKQFSSLILSAEALFSYGKNYKLHSHLFPTQHLHSSYH